MDKLKRKLSKARNSAGLGSGGAGAGAGAGSASTSYRHNGPVVDPAAPIGENDTPETVIQRAIHGFTHTPNSGDEVLHLPTIVDNAESSPGAAQIAATNIRKLLNTSHPPRVQYQAVMLLRILSDNPGPTFTRYIGSDPKYSGVIKDLIRKGRDPGVWGILRETLIHWEGEKESDEGLAKVREMWIKEKKLIDAAISRTNGGAPPLSPPQEDVGPQLPPRPSGSPAVPAAPAKKVPAPVELASRISEATSSAKLLEQLILSTPAQELPENELVKEFAERCRLAQRSLAGYIAAAEDEDVDIDTLATIIETHDVVARAALDQKKRVKEILKERERRTQTARTPEARLMDVSDPGMPTQVPQTPTEPGPHAGYLTSKPAPNQQQSFIGTSRIEPGTPGVALPTPQREVHQTAAMHGATIREEPESPVSPMSPQQQREQNLYTIPPPPPPPAPAPETPRTHTPSAAPVLAPPIPPASSDRSRQPASADPFADNAHPDNSSDGLVPTTTTTIEAGNNASGGSTGGNLGLGRFWRK